MPAVATYSLLVFLCRGVRYYKNKDNNSNNANNNNSIKQNYIKSRNIFAPVVASRRLLVCLHREVKGRSAKGCC